MTSPMTLPGRSHPVVARVVDVRRLSKPQMAWTILVATAFVVALVLLGWLLLWITRPRGGAIGWWVAQGGPASPVIGHQAEDLQPLVRGPSVLPRDLAYHSLEPSLRDRLAASRSRPVVVYLSAAGVSDTLSAALLPPGAGALAEVDARRDWLTIDRLIGPFEHGPSRKALLILDAGQVGSDRDLGVFGNGFVAKLKTMLEARKPKGLAVLCSCAPGQTSWASEADRRSVFGYYVAQGMSGRAVGWDPSSRGLTVHALANYVGYHVARWVSANRQAEQTPILLGDPSVNFALPRTAPPRALPEPDGKEAEKVLARLDAGWTRRDALQARKPYRHTPLLWQQYQATLLRAERLIRAGRDAEADDALGRLPALEKEIAEAAGGLPLDPPWSLAMLEGHLTGTPDPAKQAALKAGHEALEAALKELTGVTEEAEPEAVAVAAPQPETGSTKAPPAPEAPKSKTKAGAKGPSPMSVLLVRDDDDRPRYVEAQMLAWVDSFARRAGAPYGFKGPRGDLLAAAVQTRRLAEQAAAADERLGRRVAHLIEEGDDLRRRAQDGLFAGDEAAFDALRAQLEQARRRYREALSLADRGSRALDLVEQLESELPYYGEWKARQGTRHDDGLDPEFVSLLKAASALARQVQSEPARPEGEAPAANPDRIEGWEADARDALAAFERLEAEFQGRCTELAASGGAGRWREIDALLAVPLIPADVRRQLLRHVRSATTAASLVEADGGTSPTAAAPPSPTPDPGFWGHALGLARLERGLLEIGGIPEAEAHRLGSSYDEARAALAQDVPPGAAHDAFASFSERVRAVRAERVKAIVQPRGRTLGPLADADRAARVLPLADALAVTDRPVAALDRFHRQAMLVWHARRLLRDFAPDHARLLIEDARRVLETDDQRAALDEANAMGQARLALTTSPADRIDVREWAEQPFEVAAGAVGPIPPGDATLLVGFDPAKPVLVTEKATRRIAREGRLVPVAADRPGATVEYRVGRSESTRETVSAELKPVSFYRGRTFTAEHPAVVSIDPARDPVAVTIQQSYEGLKFRDFTDQFKEHPGQGFLHYGTNLQYKLVLTADRPLKAVVRYGLEEQPQAFQVVTVEVGPKKKAEITGVVKYDDFPIVRGKEQNSVDVAPLNLSVVIWKDREKGELQGKANYTFRMLPPSQYMSVQTDYDPVQRVVWVYVTHLANDPVTGPVDVFGSIGTGGVFPARIRRSRFVPYWFIVPATVKSVRWQVGVEHMASAFSGTIETPPPEPPPAAPPPAAPPPQ
jgi:hypothetical protein